MLVSLLTSMSLSTWSCREGTERDAEELGAREMNVQSEGFRLSVVMACNTAGSADRKMQRVCLPQ